MVAEIARVQSGQDKDKFIELHNDKPLKLAVKVRVPVKEFPKVCWFFVTGKYFQLLTVNGVMVWASSVARKYLVTFTESFNKCVILLHDSCVLLVIHYCLVVHCGLLL